MRKEILSTENAPAIVGPYSQAIKLDNLIFTSGQLPIDPKTGEMPDSVEEQTSQALENIAAILEEAGSSLDNAIKLTVFLTDIDDFAAMNEVYAGFLNPIRQQEVLLK